MALELIVGTLIALLLNMIMIGRRLYLVAYHDPDDACTFSCRAHLDFSIKSQFGAGTWVIQEIGLPLPRAILSDIRYALLAIIFADFWEWTPFMALIVLAGLQTVPVTLLDAARVDGASYIQQVWHVMLPIIKPILIIGAFLRSIDAMRIFDIPFILTGGGPGSATEVIDLFTYRLAFKSWDMGKGMAVGIVLFILNSTFDNSLSLDATSRDEDMKSITRRRYSVAQILVYLLLSILAIVLLMLIFWMIVTSLSRRGYICDPP